MKYEQRNKRVGRSLFSLRGYLLFFLLVSFVVSCCFLLFIGALQTTLGVELTRQHIQYAASITFVNVLFLSLICTVIDGIRRKITVERPLKRILKATQQFTQGDFSTRIIPFHGFDSMNEFDVIIDDFNHMAEELSGIETLRTDFIANVSHELKTPLSIIQNYATMMQMPGLSTSERVEYASSITNATHNLSELITNILRLNKLENQQIFPNRCEYELSEQLYLCILSFEDAWEKKNIQIVTELSAPLTINGDYELLSIVWNNLISNAVKFTPDGGSITVTLCADGEFAIVSVTDTGVGMSNDVGKHIFEKFYQGDASHTTQGNGLGLALVKRVVDIMGGEISAHSTPLKGSRFTVKLRRYAV